MAQVGRISGPLLFANLERNGIDLAFRNDLDTTQLLYLDVNTGRIAVNNNAPAAEIDITGITRTVNLLGDTTSIGDINFDSNNIDNLIGDINLVADEAVVLSNLATNQIYITDNTISSRSDNSNIELRPNGTGIVDVYDNLNVYSNLHATGNITLEGTITFGDTLVQDTVTFEADVNSDIIPDVTDIYSLGSASKRWNTLYTNLINGQNVSTQDIAAGGTVLNSRPGNIFYVAANGDDTNVGDHIQGPLASIQEALSRADASTSGPVVVHVLPGTYEEQLPLVVPSNVSIVGHDIRNVIVKPDISSQTQDVFYLNGETTIQNLTVKDFYYDDVNNTGYAFRFAPGAVISSRSPYVQDITVITQGTNTSQADPRGFYAGDAGKGAYINGADLNPASFDASMLFHSCTFITPGVDAITMTNGVRVEWLNSFTYFADRGLYAVDGLTGRTGQDGSTVVYGAELRSIGSANVYGNYGAVADGSDTLMYLIQHNMAYIGSAESAENDPSLAVQANEIVEQNSGQIHYVTTDHTGSFRVGDNFFIDFETGSTSVDLSTLTADTLTGLVITNAGDTTTIDGRLIETGNFRIINNTIQTLAGDFNVDSNTDTINLNNNSNVSGNLGITGDFTFDGAISFVGDAPGDGVTFNVELEQNFNPDETMAFKLGSPSKEWLSAFLNRIEVGDFSIYDNRISTNVSDADLELRANGAGSVRISDSATIDNNISVANVSAFADVNITGALNLVGDLTVTGSKTVSNDLTISQNISVGAAAQFEEILINDNYITTTRSNADLELRASGTGEIITSQPVVAQQDLTFNDGSFGNNLAVDLNLATDNANISNIEINDNYIQTTSLNADLQLRSTQHVSAPSNDVAVARDLTVSGASNLQDVSIAGVLNHTGARIQTGNYDIAGELFVDNILFEDNFVTTTTADRDLELVADGNVTVPINNTQINNNLTVSGSTSLQDLSITGALNHVGTRTQTGNYSLFGELTVDNVYIEDNVISTLASNSNLELGASGTGAVNVPQNDVQITNDLTVIGSTQINNDVSIIGLLNHIGNRTQTGDYDIAGELYVDNILFEDNFVTSTGVDQNLELHADGDGIVRMPANNVQINNNLSVNGTFNFVATETNLIGDFSNGLTEWDVVGDVTVTQDGKILLSSFGSFDVAGAGKTITNLSPGQTYTYSVDIFIISTGDIYFFSIDEIDEFGSLITLVSESKPASITYSGTFTPQYSTVRFSVISLGAEFTADNIVISEVGQTAQVLVGGTDLQDTAVTGTLLHTGNKTQTGNYTQIGNTVVNGAIAVDSLAQFENIQIDGNVLQTTDSNSSLELRASGTGRVVFDDSVRVSNNLFAASITSGNIVIDQDLELNKIVIPPSIIKIDDNFVSTTISNADLELRASGTGTVFVPSNDVTVENNLAVNGTTTLKNASVNGSVTHTASRTQTGNYTQTGNLVASGIATISSAATINNVYVSGNRIDTTSGNLVLGASGTGAVIFENLRAAQDFTSGTLTTGNIDIDGTLSIENLESSTDIQIFDNVITTTNSNSNLELRANGVGDVALQELKFNQSVIKTDSTDITLSLTDNILINTTGALIIPVGVGKSLSTNGVLRFNTDAGLFEGYNEGIVGFNGVYSDNKLTSVTAHSTNNTIDFTVNSVSVGTISSQEFIIHGLQVENININNSSITTNLSNSDLELRTNGASELAIDNISFIDSQIKNDGSNIVFAYTNNGYAKISSSKGVVFPTGTVAERPVSDPEIGDTRFNTDDDVLEVWDGSTYVVAAGTSATITESEFNDLIFEYTLIFG